MALTLIVLLIVFAVSCSAREDAEQDSDRTNLEGYKEVTIEEILANPENHAGQRVLVSGRFHALGKPAIAVDYYWTDWGIGDGNQILGVYLVSEACLFSDRHPNYDENEEIRLPGVVTVDLLGRGRFASVFLLVNMRDVDIETHPLASYVGPTSLVAKLIGGTGEIVSFDRREGRCIIETAEGLRLGFRLIELPPECQVVWVGLHVRFAGLGCKGGDNATDGVAIRLYYLEELEPHGVPNRWYLEPLELLGHDLKSRVQPW